MGAREKRALAQNLKLKLKRHHQKAMPFSYRGRSASSIDSHQHLLEVFLLLALFLLRLLFFLLLLVFLGCRGAILLSAGRAGARVFVSATGGCGKGRNRGCQSSQSK